MFNIYKLIYRLLIDRSIDIQDIHMWNVLGILLYVLRGILDGAARVPCCYKREEIYAHLTLRGMRKWNCIYRRAS